MLEIGEVLEAEVFPEIQEVTTSVIIGQDRMVEEVLMDQGPMVGTAVLTGQGVTGEEAVHPDTDKGRIEDIDHPMTGQDHMEDMAVHLGITDLEWHSMQ